MKMLVTFRHQRFGKTLKGSFKDFILIWRNQIGNNVRVDQSQGFQDCDDREGLFKKKRWIIGTRKCMNLKEVWKTCWRDLLMYNLFYLLNMVEVDHILSSDTVHFHFASQWNWPNPPNRSNLARDAATVIVFPDDELIIDFRNFPKKNYLREKWLLGEKYDSIHVCLFKKKTHIFWIIVIPSFRLW